MRINCNIGSGVGSLQALCMIQVTQTLVEASRLASVRMKESKTVAARAIKRVQELELPTLIKAEIRAILLPVTKEMLGFYEEFHGDDVPPILTHYGMVDRKKSARSILSYNNTRTERSIMWHYSLACEYCLEEEIFTLGKLLWPIEKAYFIREAASQPLEMFWMQVYQCRFDKLITGNDLSVDQCNNGYDCAVYQQNIAALIYFQTKITKKGNIDFDVSYEDNGLNYVYPPAFYASIIRLDNVGLWKEKLFEEMLLALLQWPYQNLFLMVAKSLSGRLCKGTFIMLATKIATLAISDLLFDNYKSLFVDFWKMGACLEINKWNIMDARELLHSVIRMRDQRITQIVLNSFSEDTKYYHLFNFNERCLCSEMIYNNEYEDLKFFVSVCQTSDKKLFSKFQRSLEDHAELAVHARRQSLFCNGEVNENMRRKRKINDFLRTMYKFRKHNLMD